MSGQNNPWLDRSAKELTKKKIKKSVLSVEFLLYFILISVFCHETNDEKHMGTAKMNQGHLVTLTFQYETE